jgi:hypothetical protein
MQDLIHIIKCLLVIASAVPQLFCDNPKEQCAGMLFNSVDTQSFKSKRMLLHYL